ncbi:MAG TPA: hypothetical protein VGU24_00050 [Microvirga sp.]|jgi:hypothetical protein|nr:hypothetical protein [Microvirga sp.]
MTLFPDSRERTHARALRGFLLAIIILAATFAVAALVDHKALCDGNESKAVCTRNWLNAIATAAAASFAAFAAIVAFGQYRTAAGAAALPILNDRVIALTHLSTVIRHHESALRMLSGALEAIATAGPDDVLVNHALQHWSTVETYDEALLPVLKSHVRDLDTDQFVTDFIASGQRARDDIVLAMQSLRHYARACDDDQNARELIAATIRIKRSADTIISSGKAARREADFLAELDARVQEALRETRRFRHRIITGRSEP